jgi:protein tyrosine phosphatase (PTP) superfamily phosphohydrolase (DUF442 family)
MPADKTLNMKSNLSLPAAPPTSQRRRIVALALLLPLLFIGGCKSEKPARPETWAQLVPSSALKNWYMLTPDVYRSEQPTRQGFEEIRKRGIKTIVNLRDKHSDAPLVEGLGFNLVDVPMTAWGFSEEDIVKALKAIESAPKPVLVHCQYGADRTGVVMAMYRIVVQGWTKKDALAEMTKGGYGFHWLWHPNIPAFIRKVDAAKIRARLDAS